MKTGQNLNNLCFSDTIITISKNSKIVRKLLYNYNFM